MTSDEIKAASGDITLWLKEIAYQLAVSNEQNADPEIQDDYRAVYKEMVDRGTQLRSALKRIQQHNVPVCGSRSDDIAPKFSVLCTEKPHHEGDHKTIFSVIEEDFINGRNDKVGIEYRWPNHHG